MAREAVRVNQPTGKWPGGHLRAVFGFTNARGMAPDENGAAGED
jgi:hypothetical protein